MKRKISLVFLSVLICMGLMACSNKNNDTDYNSEQDIESVDATTESEENNQVGYEEVSLDKIGEYEFAHVSYSDFSKNTHEIGYINLGNEFTDLMSSLNFANSNIRPNNFEFDIVRFDNGAMYFREGDIYDKSDYFGYSVVDESQIKDIVGNDVEVVLYMNHNEENTKKWYQAQLDFGDLTWDLSTEIIEEDYEGAMSRIISMTKCICPEYIESEPTAMHYVRTTLNYFSFNNVEFDFTNKDIGDLDCVWYNQDGSIDTITALIFRDFDSEKWVEFLIANTTMGNVKNELDKINDNVNKLYEIHLTDNIIRVYEDKSEEFFKLGFIEDDTEYILNIDTNMTLDELMKFLDETIVKQ